MQSPRPPTDELSAPSTTLRGALTYRPALSLFATLGAAWVFVLVTLGALTTSLGAGMVFADWPLSNGSLNPPGWLTDIAMFSEHSHRLSGATMGIVTIVLAVWLQWIEPRRWLRRLGWFALALVVVQGLIGGQRVRLDAIDVPGFTMTLGQMLRIPHGILAQVFVCVLFAIAASLSRRWIECSAGILPVFRRAIRIQTMRLALFATALLFLQLTVAAAMRHNHAGLAIPNFPLSTETSLIPAHWDFRVVLAFAHRALALVIAFSLIALVISAKNKSATAIIIPLLAAQITLGALAIWTFRDPLYTTAHVVCGASLFAATFTLTWWLHRHKIERLVTERGHGGNSLRSEPVRRLVRTQRTKMSALP